MNTPLVSILIPVYNAEHYLAECLQSLINQSYKNIEVLCVNDGSKDNSLKKLNSFASIDSRIKIFDKKNGGASSARNTALEYANGEYICMVDSDDYIAENALERLILAIVSTKADAVLFDLYYKFEDDSQTKFKNVPTVGCVSGAKALELSLNWSVSGVGMFKNSVFSGVRYDESNLHGDELTTRVLFSKCQLVCFSTGKYYYRQHQESSTSTFSMERFGLLDNQLKIKELLIDLGYFDAYKARYCAQLLVCIWSAAIVFEEHKAVIEIDKKNEVAKKIKFFQRLATENFSVGTLKHNSCFFKFISLISLNLFTLKITAKLFVFLKKLRYLSDPK